MKSNLKNYKKGFVFDKMKAALGEGLLTSDDELWKRQRRLIQPTFHTKRLERLMDIMMTIIKKYVARWEDYRREGRVVRLDVEILELASDIVMSTLLGENFSQELPEVGELIHAMQRYVMKLIRIPFFKPYSMLTGERRKFNRIKKEFDKVIVKIIQRRLETQEEKDDLLGMLLNARDAETGEPMRMEQLQDEFITIFVAGHETTAYAIGWSFYLLGKHPEMYAAMKAEARGFELEASMNLERYSALSFSNAVFKEAMRIYPPAYVLSRQAREKDQVQQFAVRKNTPVILSVFHLHRDQQFWEDPLSFRPDRFSQKKMSEEERNYYYPFGGGPRMCIGKNFALMESVLVLSSCFKELDYELVSEEVEPTPIITLKQKEGLHVRFK
ncbi:MAG: cytochrome P450, partial [Bacteroidota bacterium]